MQFWDDHPRLKFLAKPTADALRGLWIGARGRHMRIHTVAGIFVIGLALILNVSLTRLAILLICIMAVVCAELINSAIEQLCDFVHKDLHEDIRDIKDIAAGAVVWCCIVVVVIGVIIFWPYIF